MLGIVGCTSRAHEHLCISPQYLPHPRVWHEPRGIVNVSRHVEDVRVQRPQPRIPHLEGILSVVAQPNHDRILEPSRLGKDFADIVEDRVHGLQARTVLYPIEAGRVVAQL